jgi:hypothetical protein
MNGDALALGDPFAIQQKAVGHHRITAFEELVTNLVS